MPFKLPIMHDGINHQLDRLAQREFSIVGRMCTARLRISIYRVGPIGTPYHVDLNEKKVFSYLRMDGDLGLDPRRAARALVRVEIRLDDFWSPKICNPLPNHRRNLLWCLRQHIYGIMTASGARHLHSRDNHVTARDAAGLALHRLPWWMQRLSHDVGKSRATASSNPSIINHRSAIHDANAPQSRQSTHPFFSCSLD